MRYFDFKSCFRKVVIFLCETILSNHKSSDMKKNIFLWALLTTIFSYSHAQSKSSSVRLNAYGSYVFDDKVDDYYSSTSFYNGKIKGGFLWGAGLEYRVHDYYGIELLY